MSGLDMLAFTPFDPWHLLVIMALALLFFGKRLPEVGRSLGKGIAEFKKGLHDVQEELNKEEPPRQKLSAPPADDEAAARRFTAGETPGTPPRDATATKPADRHEGPA
jgi:sec-independent protein translocase protein TatA